MLFNSSIFLVFLVAFFLVWPLVRGGSRSRWIWLTAMSFLFYGWWDPRFLLLILGSGFLDFFCALAMQRRPERKTLYLWISILGNVGSLAIFKYMGFLTQNLQALTDLLGLGLEIPLWKIPLPVGISFYTFQSMSYTIDVYRGMMTPTRDPWHFFAYLSMFPQLVAGPIIRARDLLPQLEEWEPVSEEDRFEGTRWLVHGYFKKVVVADTLAPYVAQCFSMAHTPESAAYWWVASWMFGIQVYCDFSGYSDIARGLAKWMGYHYPENFRHPFTQTSVQAFWRNWHISLTTWFGDYIYRPLGGNQLGEWKTHRNIWVVFLVSGLWHGAAWTYVVFGAVHALWLSFERITRWPERLRQYWGGPLWCNLFTLYLVGLGWVFFRAQTISDAFWIAGRMLDVFHLGLAELGRFNDKVWVWSAVLILRELYVGLGMQESAWGKHRAWRTLEPVMLALMLLACIFLRGDGSAFVYFQF